MALTEKRFMPKKELDVEGKKALTGKIIGTLSSKQNIVFAYIYGSFVSDELFRDIDIAVYTSEETGFVFESDLSFELSTAAGYDVEAKALNNAPIGFQMEILNKGNLLFSHNEDLRTDFIESVSKRYPEYAHFRNLFLGIEGRMSDART